jgi:hypothetical protein
MRLCCILEDLNLQSVLSVANQSPQDLCQRPNLVSMTCTLQISYLLHLRSIVSLELVKYLLLNLKRLEVLVIP